MTTRQSTSTLEKLFAVLLSRDFLIAIAVLLLILLGIGHLVWLIERRHNPDFAHGYWRGIWEGLWWSAVTVTTVGYGDKTVNGALGRILGMVWMFTGIFLIANFTAFVTTELTVSELTTIKGVADLPGHKVATVAGTTSAEYLREQRIPFHGVDVIEDAYELLENGEIDAIVYDAPVLQYYAATAGNGALIVVGSPFKREDYGIALPPGSPYEEQINQALLEIKKKGTYDEIANRWFISEDGQS
jgi:ABC-type amino acid transport substrate-binding protein